MAESKNEVELPYWQNKEHMAMMQSKRDLTKRRDPRDTAKNKFFLGDKLYGRLFTDRSKAIILAWCSTDQKRVIVNYHDFLNYSEKPYTTPQVGKMLNRSAQNILQHVAAGDVKRPEAWKSEGNQGVTYPWKFPLMWRKEEILDAHTVLLTKGTGRPRKDGMKRAIAMPSRAELLAILRNDVTMYIKDSEGNMLPTWKAII